MAILAAPTVTNPKTGEKEHLSFSFHSKCFTCVTCEKELAQIPYGFYEDGFYCGECLYAVHGRTCVTCKKLITGVAIAVGNRTWCKEHFKCGQCKTLITSDKHREYKNAPICEDCYGKLTTYTCKRCNLIIDHRELVESMGFQFHKDCFVCSVGDHKLEDQEPYHEHKDLKIYCQRHFDELDKGDVCAACGKTIDSEYVQSEGQNFHATCWRCVKCNTVIQTRTAVQMQGKFYCTTCAKPDTKIHDRGDPKQVTGKRLIRGYGDYEPGEGSIPPSASKRYPMKVLQLRPPQIPREIDFRQREQYLSDEEFLENFGVTIKEFNSFPLWKRIHMKKEKKLF